MPPTPIDPGSVGLRRAMAWAVFAVPLVVTLQPVGAPRPDPDIWWHLAVGRWVAEHGTVPATDPHSRIGTPWVAYSWLYEVLVYALHARFGLAGAIAYRAAMAVAIVAAVAGLVRRIQTSDLVGTGLLAAVTLGLAPLFSERPWLVTILFSTLTLWAVIEIHDGRTPWPVWLLPAAYAVWANVHIQFIYGLFILALAVATGPRRRVMFALAALCAVATLANPYHVRVYAVVIEYATQPGPFRYVNELKAMTFREAGDWLVLGYAGAACFAAGRRWPGAFAAVLFVASAWFAFRACRDVWFVLLAGLPILARAPWPAEQPLPPSRGANVVGTIGLVAFAALLWVGRGLTPQQLEAVAGEVYPAEAAAWVRQHRPAGPLFNDFNWGGYLIWELPEYPAALDGRTNLHGDERIERFGRVWAGAPGWRDDADLSGAGVIVAPAESPLAALLMDDPRFERRHADAVAWVFVRR